MKPYYYSVPFPLTEPPPGAEGVNRWYQLDAAALSLVEWWCRAGQSLPQPKAIFLASPHASNESDGDFLKSGLSSPQKFVHTLPNVRATSLVQAMHWQGPVLCLQKDPYTWATALKEALCQLERWDRIWILGVKKQVEKHVEKLPGSIYGVGLLELTAESKASLGVLERTDAEFWKWLRENYEAK